MFGRFAFHHFLAISRRFLLEFKIFDYMLRCLGATQPRSSKPLRPRVRLFDENRARSRAQFFRHRIYKAA
jgi:predicted ferric reductase